MIQYALKCAEGHRFDSWFQSASAFDKLHAAGLINCAVCGAAGVEKAVMAPRVNTAAETDTPPERPLGAPRSPAEQALAEMRAYVEKHSRYVGRDFAREARAMHEGEADHAPIHGEANAEEARALIEDGIPVAPLPFRPTRKTN